MGEVVYFFEILLFFSLAALLAFFIPGRLLLGKEKEKTPFKILVQSLVLGMMLWGVQSFVFGFFNVRFLTYLYLVICIFLFIFKRYYRELRNFSFKKPDWISVLITAIGVLPQTLIFAPAGFVDSQGIHFPIHDAGDHIWHAAITKELVKRFPPYEPGMYGILLKNYHFWFNLITADLVRIFHLPLLGTEMIGMYLFLTLLFAAVMYLLGTTLYPGKTFARWLLFFVFFSTDAGVLFLLLLRHTFSFATQELFYTIPLFTESPAFSLAAVFALFGFYFYFMHRKNISLKTGIITAILFGTLIESKIYVGIPFLLGLWTLAGWDVLHKKFSTFLIVIVATSIALATFFPFSTGSSGLFFLPLDRARDFAIQSPFHLSYLDQRWTIYLQHHSVPRIIEYGVIFIGIYLFVQFGLRLFGLFPFKKTREILGIEQLIFLYSVLVSSFILGFFFYQRVGGANIWEFFLASLLILLFLSALNLTVLLEKKSKISVVIIVTVVLLLSLPHWIYASFSYIQDEYFTGFHGADSAQTEAYTYIKTATPKNSTILIVEDYLTPATLTSVLVERDVDLSGTGVSQILTSAMEKRIADVKIVRTYTDKYILKKTLDGMHTNYIVLLNGQKLTAPLSYIHGKLVFRNSEVSIIRVDE